MQLRVQFTKRPDGSTVLRCIRPDGSATWERREPKQAAYFSFHDLTHLAVESVLELREGFYGLIAAGWDIQDTNGKGSRGKLPPGAILVEHIVGLFQLNRVDLRGPAAAAELNEQLSLVTARDGGLPSLRLTEAQVVGVGDRIHALHAEWAATAPGATLELPFEVQET